MEAKAVKIRGKGDVDVLEIGTHEVREPGPGEVLVQVSTAGLNRADLLQRAGYYPAPQGTPSDIPGLEYSGHVAAIGDEVQGLAVGDPVMGIVGGGAMASHLVVHASEIVPVPPNLSIDEAGAIPEVFLTAYDALFMQAQLSLGQLVLIHAAGSGIGSAAIQLARSAGAIPVGTARSQAKLDRCKDLGLAHGLCVTDKTFAKALPALTAGRLPNVILDTVGAAYLAENIKALAPQGILVVIGLLGGASGDLPLGLLLAKRARIQGTVLRSRSLAEKATLVQAFTRDVIPLLARGQLVPVIDRVLPVEDIREAHTYLASNQSFGKVLIKF